jgi:hypothetical protein
LCDEVHLNLACRWLCRLGLEGSVPDHSTFTENRHGRFRDSELFRRLFEQVVRLCMHAGLVGGEGFAIDASVTEADASRNRKAPGKPMVWPEDEAVTGPVKEYLDALDTAVPCEEPDAGGRPAPAASDDMPPGNPLSKPKFTSLTDPAAAWTNKGQMKAVLAYSTNDLIDTVAAVIIDVQAGPARWSAEVAATSTTLVRTEECFELKLGRLAADAAYGSGLMIGWLQRGITPHVPNLDHDHQTKGLFTRTAFQLGTAQNHNICPGGNRLKNSGLVRDDAPGPIWPAPRTATPARYAHAAPQVPRHHQAQHVRGGTRASSRHEGNRGSARERKKVET